MPPDENRFIYLSLTLMGSPIIIFSIGAYIGIRKSEEPLLASLIRTPKWVLVTFGFFAILLAVAFSVVFFDYPSLRRIKTEMFKRDIYSQSIEVQIPSIRLVKDTNGADIYEIILKIEKLPSKLEGFYLDLSLTNGSGNTLGRDFGALYGEKNGNTWSFFDYNSRSNQLISNDPQNIVVPIPAEVIRKIQPENRQKIRISLITVHEDLNLPLGTYFFPLQLPDEISNETPF